jgi:hypothetical protein
LKGTCWWGAARTGVMADGPGLTCVTLEGRGRSGLPSAADEPGGASRRASLSPNTQGHFFYGRMSPLPTESHRQRGLRASSLLSSLLLLSRRSLPSARRRRRRLPRPAKRAPPPHSNRNLPSVSPARLTCLLPRRKACDSHVQAQVARASFPRRLQRQLPDADGVQGRPACGRRAWPQRRHHRPRRRPRRGLLGHWCVLLAESYREQYVCKERVSLPESALLERRTNEGDQRSLMADQGTLSAADPAPL